MNILHVSYNGFSILVQVSNNQYCQLEYTYGSGHILIWQGNKIVEDINGQLSLVAEPWEYLHGSNFNYYTIPDKHLRTRWQVREMLTGFINEHLESYLIADML